MLLRQQRERGIDQPDMAEPLREVAQRRAVARVDLFGEQADVVRAGEQLLEALRCPGEVAGLRLTFDRPEGADGERSLVRLSV